MDKVMVTIMHTNIEVVDFNNNKKNIKLNTKLVQDTINNININLCEISKLNDNNLLKFLIGLYYKNGIILDMFIDKSINPSDILDTFYLNTNHKINNINKLKNLLIKPDVIINKMNKLLDNSNNYMELIENNYIFLNQAEEKLVLSQNNARINYKLNFIEKFKKNLLLKEFIQYIKTDLYNDFNYLYLETLTLKYNIVTINGIDELIELIEKIELLETTLKKLNIPFYFKNNDNNKEYEFAIKEGNININYLLELMGKGIDSDSISIII